MLFEFLCLLYLVGLSGLTVHFCCFLFVCLYFGFVVFVFV